MFAANMLRHARLRFCLAATKEPRAKRLGHAWLVEGPSLGARSDSHADTSKLAPVPANRIAVQSKHRGVTVRRREPHPGSALGNDTR